MDTLTEPETFHQPSIFARLLPLIEEHLLCSMKINQLKASHWGKTKEEKITILENLQRQDERRLIEALRSAGNKGI